MSILVMNKIIKELSTEQYEKLIVVLKARFEKNMIRHNELEWAKVKVKLDAKPEKLWSLNEMEKSGGEPDVIIARFGVQATRVSGR